MNENKKLHVILIIAGIAGFFGVLLIFYLVRLGVFTEDTKSSKVLNNQVSFEQPKLTIFDETRYINAFPDTIHIHYPYFIVVVPEDTNYITTVYNLEEKRKVATYNDIVLDYYKGDYLYNHHGGNTIFKGKDLGLHCDQGFIKSDNEILCITSKDKDPMDNKLVNINPQTLATKDLYSPQNALTAVYYDKSTLYIGEYNFASNYAYLTVNHQTTEVDNLINIIYPMKNKLYAASFKSVHNNRTESYYEIVNSNNTIKTQLLKTGKIVFY